MHDSQKGRIDTNSGPIEANCAQFSRFDKGACVKKCQIDTKNNIYKKSTRLTKKIRKCRIENICKIDTKRARLTKTSKI